VPHELLVEIGVEDIPPFAVSPLCRQLEAGARAALQEARLAFDELSALSAPRRLALRVSGLAARQPDRSYEVRGPAKKVAYDEAGVPTKAAEGFCRGRGARVEDAYVKESDGGAYLFLTVEEAGRPAAEVLLELLPRVLEQLVPPETMRWESSGVRFIRPVRWLLGLLDDAVVPFAWAGLHAGNASRGHRFAGDETLTVERAEAYVAALRAAHVLVDPDERRARIAAQLAEAGETLGARLEADGALTHTLVHSAEWPSAIPGRFDERFLALPPEVLSTTMIQHQRFVPGFEPEGGAILPHFVGFRDGPSARPERVRRGYERVLEARLVDSEYFFNADRQRSLAEHVPDLKSVRYQAKLGSVWDKTERIRSLAQAIGMGAGLKPRPLEALDRAAYLCKADLVTLMVGEFPELQGVMGGVYAELDGEPAPVADAIRSHYQPKGPDDPLPESVLGVCLSLADKLDTVVGSLLIGQRPSGSGDPFGLRRAANAVVRAALKRELGIDFFALLRERADLYAFLEDAAPWSELEDFFCERLKAVLIKEYGVAYDVADAVLAPRDGHFLNVLHKARSLERLRGSDDFGALAAAFGRASNILSKRADETPTSYEPKRFQEQAERDLWRALLKIETQIDKRLPRADFDGILRQLLTLKDPIDAYFDEVMVMADDDALRRNRLGLLNAVACQFMLVGDLSKVVFKGEG